MKTIDPYLPSGFRDYLPAESAARSRMFDTIRKTFETFGFTPIDTPRIEREAVLTGGDEEFDKQIFKIADRNESDPLALRFDLTVPLARFVALHRNDLSFPFKRYQIGMVWRAEHAQAGRFREFTQCDADTIGARGVFADAEVIALVYRTFSALGISDFKISISNRKVLNGIAAHAGIPAAELPKFFRMLDKSGDEVGRKAFDGYLVGAVADSSLRSLLSRFLGSGAEEASRLLAENNVENRELSEGAGELKELTGYLTAMGVPETAWEVNLSIVRGLGYYTGTVFETFLTNQESFGSVCSGGRYDDLVGRFGGAELSGVGMSIGIDRLFAALTALNPSVGSGLEGRVIILPVDTLKNYSASVASDLRTVGIPTDVYLGGEDNLKGQLAFAIKNGFRIAIIAGSSEVERGVVQVKDLKNRTQEEVDRKEVVNFVSDLLTK